MKAIGTDRLVLRMFRQSDLDAYAAMHADPEVMRFLGEGKPLSRADAWQSMAVMAGHWHLRGFGLWAVQTRESDEMIGRVGCWYPEGWPGFEIGWTIARPHWGRGYATEAARVALAHAFGDLNQPKIISLIRPGNQRSVRVPRRSVNGLRDRSKCLGKRFWCTAWIARSGRKLLAGTESTPQRVDRPQD